MLFLVNNPIKSGRILTVRIEYNYLLSAHINSKNYYPYMWMRIVVLMYADVVINRIRKSFIYNIYFYILYIYYI
jgi:hypothetical protein